MHLHHHAALSGCTVALSLLGSLVMVPPALAGAAVADSRTAIAVPMASVGDAVAEKPSGRPKNKLLLRFAGPAEVPSRLRIEGPQATVVVPRPEMDRNLRIRIPVGAYRLSAPSMVVDDQFYVARLNLRRITLQKGDRTAIKLTMVPGRRGDVSLVSVSDDGTQADAGSSEPVVNGDGRYVAFTTAARLAPGDRNNARDVYLRDRELRTTVRVSDSVGGDSGNAGSHGPSISDDGRYVAFVSRADDLVAGDADTQHQDDVFVWDRVTDETVRIGLPPGGGEPDGATHRAAISGDGLHVAFVSAADNLVADNADTNGHSDVFVWDAETGTTSRINVGPGGAQADADSVNPQISDDGGVVAYESAATTLGAGDPPDRRSDIFVWHRSTGETTWESRTRSGGRPDDVVHSPALSGDGRFLAFESLAGNLVPGRREPAMADVFVRNLESGALRQVPLPYDGRMTTAHDPSLSQDGRSVLYELALRTANLEGGYVHDLVTGEFRQVTRSSIGKAVDPVDLVLSDDAGVVVALADSGVLQDDLNRRRDVFAWTR